MCKIIRVILCIFIVIILMIVLFAMLFGVKRSRKDSSVNTVEKVRVLNNAELKRMNYKIERWKLIGIEL